MLSSSFGQVKANRIPCTVRPGKHAYCNEPCYDRNILILNFVKNWFHSRFKLLKHTLTQTKDKRNITDRKRSNERKNKRSA